jgi:DNA-binding transcriptional LysR family regulator
VILGVLPTIAPYLLPAVLVDFVKKFPGVEIAIHEDTHGAVAHLFVCAGLSLISLY